MIKNVIFDFGDVIARFDPKELVAAFTEDVAQQKILQKVLFERWEELDAGTLDYTDYQREVLEKLPEDLHETAKCFFKDWYRAMPMVEGIKAFIMELKNQGYGLYILSNASVYFAEKSPYFGVHSWFDGIVFSACIKMTKPREEIYRYLLDTYALKPEECLFLDDRKTNIEGAEKVGIHGLVFTGKIEEIWKYLKKNS